MKPDVDRSVMIVLQDAAEVVAPIVDLTPIHHMLICLP